MKLPDNYINKFTVENKNRDLFGEALSEYFGKPMYSIYRKFGRARSERLFNEMKKKGDRNFTHFMQLLNHDGQAFNTAKQETSSVDARNGDRAEQSRSIFTTGS